MSFSSSSGERVSTLDGWKLSTPYRIRGPDEDFPVKYEGHCHCGLVKYQISRQAPLDCKLCHCSTCQSQHAAPFQWAAIFHKDDINFVNGSQNLEWYDPTGKCAGHKLPCKVRCAYCHSPIMDEGRNMVILFPSLITFKSDEERALFRPRSHMFYGARAMEVPDGLPKWEGLNNSSNLIGDSPPELVRRYQLKCEAERIKQTQAGNVESTMQVEERLSEFER